MPRYLPRPTRRRAHGMTLMELMVSVAILASMVLAFNLILSSTQQVVSTTQRDIRANAAAMAIAHVVRRDFRGLSKDGWLYIGSQNGTPVLAFTVAGASESVTGKSHGNGSIVCYRLAENTVTSATKDLFARIALVLDKDTDADASSPWPVGDRYNADLKYVQKLPAANVLSEVVTPLSTAQNLVLPPDNTSQVRELWKVLTQNISELKFYYGTRLDTGSINWQDAATNPGTWTFRDQDAWPVAVRIQFN